MNMMKIASLGLAFLGASAQYTDTLYSGSTTTVNIQEAPSSTNSVQTRTITFTAAESCSNPSLTFTYEEIDYNSYTSEYLDLYYGATRFANCYSVQSNCGNIATCTSSYSLSTVGISSLVAGNSVSFTLEIGGQVDSLCTSIAGSGLAVNAYLSITCGGAITSTSCSAASDYTGSVSPGGSETVYIQETPSPTNAIQTVSICIGVPSSAGDCLNPTVNFTYEEIDYNSYSTEYLDLAYAGQQFSNCYSNQYNCGNFDQCLVDYDLSNVGLNSIASGSTASFTLEIGGQVDSLCTSTAGSGLAVNAEFTITCSTSTLSCTGPQSHEIDASGATVDASQCGLGCTPALSAQDCNDQCLATSGCVAYVYAPSQTDECAMFSSLTPVARAATQVMCTPCRGSYAQAENPNPMDAIKYVQAEVMKGKEDNNMWLEFLALNAAVSAGVSLVVLCVVIATCYCCGAASNRTKYSRVHEEKDVEMDN